MFPKLGFPLLGVDHGEVGDAIVDLIAAAVLNFPVVEAVRGKVLGVAVVVPMLEVGLVAVLEDFGVLVVVEDVAVVEVALERAADFVAALSVAAVVAVAEV